MQNTQEFNNTLNHTSYLKHSGGGQRNSYQRLNHSINRGIKKLTGSSDSLSTHSNDHMLTRGWNIIRLISKQIDTHLGQIFETWAWGNTLNQSFVSQTHVIMEITFNSETDQNQKYINGSYHEISYIFLELDKYGTNRGKNLKFKLSCISNWSTKQFKWVALFVPTLGVYHTQQKMTVHY